MEDKVKSNFPDACEGNNSSNTVFFHSIGTPILAAIA